MRSSEIRRKFLEFFKSKGHEIVPSDTLVPKDDPTLLFTSAGMNQFKEQFMGRNITYRRAASCQKCLRTGDLENVGRTSGHHTFFEMLGNFSFGDYFKKEACVWAWEFMTEALNLSKEKLWVSIYEDDDEAYKIWLELVKVPKKRIVKFGAKKNFWPSNAPTEGPNGPCGPCSEIFYDWGKGTGCGKKSCNPSCDCGRFVEVWNLVFTQFSRMGKNKLQPLPNRNIDTGMGLERITAVMQGVKTNFETDLFKPIIDELTTHALRLTTNNLNTIADHIRAATFAICDGVSPSNEFRGYVVRKLIRRAYLLSKTNKAFLYNIVPKIVKIMQDTYPELKSRREDITLVVKGEEEKFQNTLFASLPKLEELIEEFRKQRKIPGEQIFKLVDTYGLPLEVIEKRTAKAKYKLDIKGYEECMENQRYRSRDKSKIESNIFVKDRFKKAPMPKYSKDDPLKHAEIVYLVPAGSKEPSNQVLSGERVEVLTSPQSAIFYTGAGGQVGDSGIVKSELDGSATRILNTYKEVGGRVIHDCISEGQLALGIKVTVELNKERKKEIAKNHTATHLLQAALRKVLGEHVRQAGSLVDDKHLRFDFRHMKKLSERELERVENLVNEKIQEAIAIKRQEKTRKEAEKEGAIALFGEKYGDKVRVVAVSDYSKELCGGTHVDNTNEIGMFKIIRESSIAAGIRRIEALTGDAAGQWTEENKKLKLKNEKLKEKKDQEKKLEKERLKDTKKNIDSIIKKALLIEGAKIITEEIENANMNILRRLSADIRNKEKSAFIMLAGEQRGKVFIVLSITDDLVNKGMDARLMIKEIAKGIGGSGGGRKDFAQAGGKDASGIKQALEKAKEIFRSKI